jgi:DNA-directed RNA polymerase specialized sigma24 family protein
MLRVALDGLPPRQQAALRLAVAEQLTVQDIATRLNATRAEVLDAMRVGLGSLRDVLEVVDPALASGFAERNSASSASDREQT